MVAPPDNPLPAAKVSEVLPSTAVFAELPYVTFKVAVPPVPSVIVAPPDNPVPAVTVSDVLPSTAVFEALPYTTDQFDIADEPL